MACLPLSEQSQFCYTFYQEVNLPLQKKETVKFKSVTLHIYCKGAGETDTNRITGAGFNHALTTTKASHSCWKRDNMIL